MVDMCMYTYCSIFKYLTKALNVPVSMVLNIIKYRKVLNKQNNAKKLEESPIPYADLHMSMYMCMV